MVKTETGKVSSFVETGVSELTQTSSTLVQRTLFPILDIPDRPTISPFAHYAKVTLLIWLCALYNRSECAHVSSILISLTICHGTDRRLLYSVSTIYVLLTLAVLGVILPFGGRIRCEHGRILTRSSAADSRSCRHHVRPVMCSSYISRHKP